MRDHWLTTHVLLEVGGFLAKDDLDIGLVLTTIF